MLSIPEQLADLRSRSLHRSLREIVTPQGNEIELVGRKLLNFSSNDYLGLAAEPALADAARAALDQYGVGAGASRLVSGTLSPHIQLEKTLAAFKRTESALTFASGHAAALGAVQSLVGKHDVIIIDKLAHACLIDAARLSQSVVRVFPHNHLGKLESHLEWAQENHPDSRVLIITESIFSMDGDHAPLVEIVALKVKYDAYLLVDEAHALGVIGAHGRGLAEKLGVANKIDLQMGTMSKALGVSGGYICGSRVMIELLVNRARSFIFSTAVPPMLAAAATAAVQFVSSAEGDERRKILWRNIRHLEKGLRKIDPEYPAACSAILPWIVGDEEAALLLARSLFEEGFHVPAIRYPTVARSSARLRITVNARHTLEQINALCEALARLCPPPES
ncbi:MAG TPA: 8-amino-7-oxononanoate synthase [Chthoniobacterales bacterium]